MRKCRYQKGSVKKQRGRWVAMWWVDRRRKSRVIGLVKDMTKSEARAVVDRIVTEVNAKQQQNRVWRFGEFVAEVYFPYYSRKWKDSTRENNVNRVSVHLVGKFGSAELSGFRRDELQDLLDREGAGRPVVFRRRSSALGYEADFRYGRGRGPYRAQSRAVAVHAQGSGEACAPRDDHEGGAKLFCGARPEGAVDRQARGDRRDASG